MFKILLNTLSRAGMAPDMSSTERTALQAGDVWLDGELFSGRPDFRSMLKEVYPELSERERDFLEGPVEEVCHAMDTEHTDRTKEIPAAVWALLKKHRFFGLGIPEAYGGHGFSALAQSTIFGKLGSRSMPLSSVVLIPNSVGPGELLVEVGTEEQKSYYLPRLASGQEIPCFALTEPEAGSDAGSLTSRGVLFQAPGSDGRPGELSIRLDWDKRYITLAPIATLLGLAFRLYDPEGLLGREQDLGITCALVPTRLPGVEIGSRHDPLGVPFPNGPTRGFGVEIPAANIIGGVAKAGHGWQMLMEALSGGRAVSLPGQATVGAKYVARVAGAYSMVRQQFGLSVGRFEGVEEALARVAGRAYLLEAARVFTCGALDAGKRPAVVSAMMKYNSTELSRQSALDGMDIMGGAAICLGPRNLMARAWQASPIGITVEGANILTRTLIVFGQGAIRCHPFAHRLLESIRRRDLPEFRRALVGHQLHVVANFFRGLLLGLSRGHLRPAPVGGAAAPYFRRLAWASARFAFYSDLAMMTLGSGLKKRGRLTGRLADMLSWMYLVFACLRRFEAEGRQKEDEALMQWACEEGLFRIQESFEGVLQNLDVPLLGPWLRGPASWWARLNPMGKPPADHIGSRAAQSVRRPGAQRDRLTPHLHIEPGSPWAELEEAFELCHLSEPAVAKIRSAMRAGALPKTSVEDALAEAVERDIVSAEQAGLIRRSNEARAKVIQVDEMSLEALRGHARVSDDGSSTDASREVAGG